MAGMCDPSSGSTIQSQVRPDTKAVQSVQRHFPGLL